MKFTFILPSTLTLALLTQTAFADLPKPQTCPSVPAIKQMGVNYIVLTKKGRWFASYLRSKYDTSVEWTFVLGGTDEKVGNETEAREKAMKELQSLRLTGGPFYDEAGDTACTYATNKIDSSITITPPLQIPAIQRYAK